MYRIAICDDEENTCTALEEMLESIAREKNCQVEIEVWNTGEKFRDSLKAGNSLDLIFLDIELVRLSGVEVGRFIREELEDFRTSIVYISHKQSYAMELFKMQPLDFLQKPLAGEQVKAVFTRFLKIKEKGMLCFGFHSRNTYCQYSYEDIRYFNSQNKKIIIHTLKGKDEFYGKLSEIYPKLPPNFWQIHKSYIINKDYVDRFFYENVLMKTKEVLLISKTYRKTIKYNFPNFVRLYKSLHFSHVGNEYSTKHVDSSRSLPY